MLLSEFHDDHWLPGIECLRECTRIGYESAWRRHIMPALGHTDMEDIDVETVESWLARIPSRGAARKAWSVLRAMLRKAIKPQLLALFIAICSVGIIIVGYFFNFIQGYIL